MAGLGGVSLLLPAAAAVVAGGLALRAAGPLVPPAAVALAAALLAFAAPLASAPRPPYVGRLWRAAIFGAYSGLDPKREELRRVVLEAADTGGTASGARGVAPVRSQAVGTPRQGRRSNTFQRASQRPPRRTALFEW